MNAEDCLWNQQFRTMNPEDHLVDEQLHVLNINLTVKFYAINFPVVVITTFLMSISHW